MRSAGIVLIAVGFAAAVLGGLALAVQVSSGEMDAGGALLGALLIFVPVGALVGAGIYWYVKAESAVDVQPNTEMLKPRQLLDALRDRGALTVDAAAAELGVGPADVRVMLDELTTLRVFSGYVNWDDALMCAMQPDTLHALTACAVCGLPVALPTEGQWVCQGCRTEYYLPQRSP